MFERILNNGFMLHDNGDDWARRIRERDEQSRRELAEKLAECREKHPGPKVVEYNPPEPDTPYPPVKPSSDQTWGTFVSHVADALERKEKD